MSIHVLPAEIADQIAAGEVVERPASVIKELVENSIDAGAKNIVVRIFDGGKKGIYVSDDGAGMSPDDAEKSILRHATSKISTIDDLFSIHSFGFRGEALAAISSVSEFTLITKKSQEKFGTKVFLSAGKDKKVSDSPANTGTSIEIKNLFFPTPVRLKHLKNSSTEFRHIWKEIQGFALAFPDVSFEVYKDDVLYKNLPSSSSQERALEMLDLPKNDVLALSYKRHGMTLSGFIVSPGCCLSNKNKQYFFVNGRRIEDSQASFAIREAYLQTAGIERHLHPAFVLFLEVDPLLVDVNIHPRKREVKFSEPRDVFSLLKRGVQEVLNKAVDSLFSNPTNSSVSSFSPAFSYKNSPSSVSPNKKIPGIFSANPSLQTMKLFSQKNTDREWALQNNSQEKISEPDEFFGELSLVGQVARKYIVAEAENGIYFFDQHALHERERFEVFWNDFQSQKKSGTFVSQKLLLPEKVSLEMDSVEILCEEKNKSQLLKFGFDFNVFDDDHIEVSSIPSLLEGEKIPEIFASFAEYFSEGKIGETYIEQCMRKRLEYKSCRGAVMFGDSLEPSEMQRLLDDFQKTKWRNLCPHGRPNHWFVPFDELDQKFHR